MTSRFPVSTAWQDVLKEFRALGGIAENVTLRPHGHWGPGLFSANPDKPFVVDIPASLLFRVENVEFVDGAIRIKNSAPVASAERDFFARYQKVLSWGEVGESGATLFIEMLDAVPLKLHETLVADFAMQEFFEGTRAERIQGYFLRSRAVMWNGTSVIVPFIELARRCENATVLGSHEPGHLRIEGEVPGEIFVAFGRQDPLGIFRKFGLPAARLHAFSLPVRTKVGTADLTIGRNPAAKEERAGFVIPQMKSESGELFLSHLMLGNSTFPRASRGIFYTLMREAGVTGSDEAFDRVLQFNKGAFLRLLEMLEPLRGEIITRLRRMAHFQLGALAHCVGAREL